MPRNITLSQILTLVGTLDDSPGEEVPRKRFRAFLKNVTDTKILREYIDECYRNKDEQFKRALQDIVNHIGELLGYQVTFGRYESSFDGCWKSTSNYNSMHACI